MSGEMNTSLGNGLTNLIVWSFLVHKKGGRFVGFVEGDDGIFATDVDVTSDDYAEYGFDVKVNDFDDPLQASFCGIMCSEDFECITDPRRKFQTFGWTSSFISAGEDKMMELLRAKALSLVYEMPQCPILGVLARDALIHTRGYEPRFVWDGYHNVDVPCDERLIPAFNPKMSTRVAFQKAYGISIHTQLLAEQMIKTGMTKDLASVISPSADNVWYCTRYVYEG